MAEYNTHVSQKGFNPPMEQSKFNPLAPVSDISSDYQRKVAVANQIMSIASSFGKSFGLAHQRKQEQEEINTLAERKIFREELIQAEIAGRALAGGGGIYNETIAKKILRDSNAFRRANPELIVRLNRGYQLKIAELELFKRNSDLNVNAENIIEQLGFEWIKQRQDSILSPKDKRGGGREEREEEDLVPDFPEFISEYIDDNASKTTNFLINKYPLIDEVLAKEGKRLNYDPYYNAAAKWYKNYKDREKQKLINNALSKQSWSEINNLQSVRNLLKKEFGIFRNQANNQIVGFLSGYFQNKVSNEGDDLLKSTIFNKISNLLTQGDEHGVSLLMAGGIYNVGADAKVLLNLVKSTQKRLYDKAEKLSNNSANKAEKERKLGLQLQFTLVFAGVQKSLSNPELTLNDIIDIRGKLQEIIKVPLDKNIAVFGTLGKNYPVDLIKLIDIRKKEIQTDIDKPKEERKLTPDEKQIRNAAGVKFRDLGNNIKAIQNFDATEESIDKVIELKKEVESIYSHVINGTTDENGLKRDWKDFPQFNKLKNDLITDINNQLVALEARIEKANEKQNVKTQTYNNYKKQYKNEVENSILKASIISSFHESLEQFLKLPVEERLDSNLNRLETVLDKQVNKFKINDKGLLLIGDQPKDKVPLFSDSEQNMYLNKIADTREAHQREIDAKRNVSPIKTDPELFETMNQKIRSLVNVPPLDLYKERGNTEGRITKIKGDLSRKYQNKELTTTDYNHFWRLLTKLSSDVDSTLNEIYGYQTVFNNAYKSLLLSITGSIEQGLYIEMLSSSKTALLNNTTEDLTRFHETMVKRYPNTFSNTNHENHPLRRAILNAYVEWLKGKEKTVDILKSYIGIREYTGEKKSRFTDREIRIFEDSIPKDESPYKARFEDLSLKIDTNRGFKIGTSEGKKEGGDEISVEDAVIQKAKHEVHSNNTITDEDLEYLLFKNN